VSHALHLPDSFQHNVAWFLSCSVLQESLLKATISLIYSQQMLAEQRNALLTVAIQFDHLLPNFSSVAFFSPEHISLFSSALQMFIFQENLVHL